MALGPRCSSSHAWLRHVVACRRDLGADARHAWLQQRRLRCGQSNPVAEQPLAGMREMALPDGAWRPRTSGGRTTGFTAGNAGSTERVNDLAATDQIPALARRGPSTTSALANPNHRPSQAVARTKGRGLLLTTHFSGADKRRVELGHTLLPADSPGSKVSGCEALLKVGPLQLKPSVGRTLWSAR